MHFTCNWVVLDVFNISRNKVLRSSVEVIKSVQESPLGSKCEDICGSHVKSICHSLL